MAAAIGIILLKLVVLLLVAKIAGELAERVKQPAVLGELLAGVLLGPSLFGLVDLSQRDDAVTIIAFLASFGAVILLMEVGLETRLKELLGVGVSATLVAIIGIVGAFAFGFGASWALGKAGVWTHTWLFHVFVGATLTATSVGITARILSDMGRLATAEARTILGAAVLDDVGGLLILAVVSALAAGALDPGALALKAGFAIAFLLVALALGVRIAPRVLDLLARARVRGLLIAAAVAFTLLMAYLAELTGLAGIVGAFAAGLILAQTRQQPALHDRMRTLGDVFVPIFFVYVGLQVDLRGIGADVVPMLVVATALILAGIAGKLIAGFGVVERTTSKYAVGVGMVPRGEVGLIFALIGVQAGLIVGWQYTALLLAIAVTTFITPIWLKRALSRAPPAMPDNAPIVATTDAHGHAMFVPTEKRPREGPDWPGR